MNTYRFLILLARLVLAGVFIAAALPKLQDPEAFAVSVRSFRILEGTSSAWIALVLPWLELAAGIGLLVPRIRRASGLALGALLLLFVGLHLSAWARGLDIACGCFGESEAGGTAYHWNILRNLGLIALLVPTLWIDVTRMREPEP